MLYFWTVPLALKRTSEAPEERSLRKQGVSWFPVRHPTLYVVQLLIVVIESKIDSTSYLQTVDSEQLFRRSKANKKWCAVSTGTVRESVTHIDYYWDENHTVLSIKTACVNAVIQPMMWYIPRVIYCAGKQKIKINRQLKSPQRFPLTVEELEICSIKVQMWTWTCTGTTSRPIDGCFYYR